MSASSLGYRDAGSVLLSKADAERGRADLRRTGGRDEPAVFTGAVLSRRKPRVQKDADADKDHEAAALTLDRSEVWARRAEGRLRWLSKALVLVGKKAVKAQLVYDIVAHRKFVAGASDKTGERMRALLLANLHVFSAKQQKYFSSEANEFSSFGTSAPKDRAAARRRRAQPPAPPGGGAPPARAAAAAPRPRRRRPHRPGPRGERPAVARRPRRGGDGAAPRLGRGGRAAPPPQGHEPRGPPRPEQRGPAAAGAASGQPRAAPPAAPRGPPLA
ncbi:unnamed protein product [Prorocentrum cordatum]|uniref:Uncharacterized protein n=1 Tax=Prorocentrum cordatum TaxID=2364126 RepID=A0ABN9SMU0_9DINO|nr:unnamed protein product [Polarella glacialis]